MDSELIPIEVEVNSKRYSISTNAETTLLEVLREQLGLKGTKKGCNNGHCGACTVIMDGKAVDSCLILAVNAHKKKITTIEGLASDDGLHPIQEAFIDEGAVQCGFCTPGMIMSAKALLSRNADPVEEEIKEALSGNLCRCTGYEKIIKAVTKAGKKLREED